MGTAIAENALARAGTDIIEADEQHKIDKQIIGRQKGECDCGLPRQLCTIEGHGPRHGVGRVR